MTPSNRTIALVVFAVSLLLQHVEAQNRPASLPDPAKMQKLIYDLSRNAVTERMRAVATLKDMGPAAKQALPMLRAAYAREEAGPFKIMMQWKRKRVLLVHLRWHFADPHHDCSGRLNLGK